MTDLLLHRPGAVLAYDVTGPGVLRPMLVTAHGLTSSRANEDATGVFDWSPVVASGRTVARFDARGHGASTGRAQPEDWHWPDLAADLLAITDAVSPDQPVDGLGVSMGSGTLLWAAVTHPQRFHRLVLVIPPTAWSTRAAQAELYEQNAAFIEERGKDAWIRGMAALPPHPILEAGGWARGPDADVAEELLPTVFRGAAGTDLPGEDELAALKQEVLLLPWAEDPGHPVSTAERLAELLPNARLEVATTPEDIRGWGPRIAAFLEE